MGRSARPLSWLKRYVFSLYCAVVIALVVFSYSRPVPSLSLSVAAPPPVLGELWEVVSYVYEPDGRRRYRSESDVMKRLRDGDVLTLEPLTMRYYSEGKPTVFLASESGKVLDKGKRIMLSGAVALEKLAESGDPHEAVHTSEVEVKMDQEIAVTQEAVTIRRGGQVTSGRGMVADLRRGEINLLEEVKVRRE